MDLARNCETGTLSQRVAVVRVKDSGTTFYGEIQSLQHESRIVSHFRHWIHSPSALVLL